jgi:hypothetical protein
MASKNRTRPARIACVGDWMGFPQQMADHRAPSDRNGGVVRCSGVVTQG